MSASFSTGLIGGNFVIGDNRIISISPSSGTNTAGQNLTLQSGQGTGTGTGGSIMFQTAPGGSSGSSANDLATKLTITTEGIQVAGTGSMSDTLSLTKSSGTGLSVTKDATIGGNLTVTGNLTVSGTSTTITSSTLEVNDKNIVIGNVSGPTNSTADGGGITLKANGDKTIIYTNSGDRWTSNIHWNIALGKEYQINGTAILTSTALGSTVVGSSLTSVGTIGTGVWNATAIADNYISSAATWNAKQSALTFGKSSGNTLKSEEALVTNDILLMGTNNVKGRTYSEFKGDLSLNNVENTALSTWAGSTNITSIGTITTGTWSATTIAVAKGGTGQTTYTAGQLLIGNSSNGLTKSTLTAGSNVTVTNDNGSITIASTDTNTQYTGGTGITLSSTTFNLDTASASALGGVKVGTGLAIDGSGVLSSTSSGKWSGSTDIYYTSGDVGIGTTTPDSNIKLQIESNHNDGARLKIKSTNSSTGWKSPVIDLSLSDDSSNLIFAHGGNGGGIWFRPLTNKDIVFDFQTGTGKVGIGNQAPSYKLDVSGTGRFTDTLSLTKSSDTGLSVTSNATIGGNLTVTGNLIINGTTTTVNSTTMTVDDPIITLGGDTAPGSDDNKDRGVEFRYYDGSAKVGFMGWDNDASNRCFVLLKDATNSSEVFSGTAAELKVGSLTIGSDTVSNLSSLLTTSSALSSLSNVHTTAPSDNQVLTWDGTNNRWEPANASGGGGSSALNDLTDVSTSGAQNNYALVYNGSSWAPAAQSGSGGGSAGTVSVNSVQSIDTSTHYVNCEGTWRRWGVAEGGTSGGLEATITPQSSSSKVKLSLSLVYGMSMDSTFAVRIIRTVGGVSTPIMLGSGESTAAAADNTSYTNGQNATFSLNLDHQHMDHHTATTNYSSLDEPNTTSPVTYHIQVGSYVHNTTDYKIRFNRNPHVAGSSSNIDRSRFRSTMILEEFSNFTHNIAEQKVQGRVLETLAGVCDGRSVSVSSGTYTLEDVDASFEVANSSWDKITGSGINYKPPPGAKQVIFQIDYSFKGSGSGTKEPLFHTKLKVGNSYVENQEHCWRTSVGYIERVVTDKFIIDIGNVSSDDITNGKLSNWDTNRQLQVDVRAWSGYGIRMHALRHDDGTSDGTSSGYVRAPKIEITAIGEENLVYNLTNQYSITEGQVLETLAGVCDGRSVSGSSGTYTFEEVTTGQEVPSTWTKATGSGISYKPPPGTKVVKFTYRYAMRIHDNNTDIWHQLLYLDNTAVTFSQETIRPGSSNFETINEYSVIFSIGGTNDVANGKLASWDTLKTIEVRMSAVSSRNPKLHNSNHSGPAASGTDLLIPPQIEITAIGRGIIEGTIGNLYSSKVNMVKTTYSTQTTLTAPSSLPGVNVSGLNLSIKPTATDSVIELKFNLWYEALCDNMFRITRNIDGTDVLVTSATNIWEGGIDIPKHDADTDSTPEVAKIRWYDEPNTTSTVTYKLWVNSSHTGASKTIYLNRTHTSTGASQYETGVSTAIAIELPQQTTLHNPRYNSVIEQEGQTLETLAGVCDGRTVTVSSGTYTLGNVSADQQLTTSWVDITGTPIDYKPPPGTKYISYKLKVYRRWGPTASSGRTMAHYKLYIDSNEIEGARTNRGGGTYEETYDTIMWTFEIGNTNDIANGKLLSWDSLKTIKVQAREFSSSYEARLHKPLYWDGGESGQPIIKPRLEIVAIGRKSDTTFLNSFFNERKGQVLETLAGVCDGRSVTVDSGTYTLPTTTSTGQFFNDDDDFKVVEGSSISYKPPPGTKQVIFKFSCHIAAYEYNNYNNSINFIASFQGYLDTTALNFKFAENMYGGAQDTETYITMMFEIGGTNDIANGKLTSWDTLKTISLKARAWNYAPRSFTLHVATNFGTTAYHDNANPPHIPPRIEIQAIGDAAIQNATVVAGHSMVHFQGFSDTFTTTSGVHYITGYEDAPTSGTYTAGLPALKNFGSAMNTSTGIFTTPHTGLYSINVVVHKENNTSAGRVYLVIDGKSVAFGDIREYYDNSGASGVYHIDSGKQVYLKGESSSTYPTAVNLSITALQDQVPQALSSRPGMTLETLAGVCDGSSVTVSSGTYTLPNVTNDFGVMTNGTTYVELPGSFSYKPPTGTNKVIYRFKINIAGYDTHGIANFKVYVDDTEVTKFIRSWTGHGPDEGPIVLDYTFEIGKTNDITSGKFLTWDTLKTIKIKVRSHTASSHRVQIFSRGYWEGSYMYNEHTNSGGDGFVQPSLEIVAIGDGPGIVPSTGTNVVHVSDSTYFSQTVAPNTILNYEYQAMRLVITPTATDSVIELKYNVFTDVDQNIPFRITRNINGTDVLLVPTTDVNEGCVGLGVNDNDTATTPFIVNFWYYDEPNTTSTVTYKLWLGSTHTSSTRTVYFNGGNSATGGQYYEYGVSRSVAIEYPKTARPLDTENALTIPPFVGATNKEKLYNQSGDLYFNGKQLSNEWFKNGGDLYRLGANVGIGKSSPVYKLDVTGDINFTGNLRQNGSAYIGIGTTSPSVPFEVAMQVDVGAPGTISYLSPDSPGANGHTLLNSSHSSRFISIKSQGTIWAGGWILAGSDRRIKENIEDVNSIQALTMLRNIPCRYYEYKDKIKRGSGKVIGFIAQEVKSVLPMAIDIQTEIIPNVYKIISCEWKGNVMYSQELGIVSGVKYKFYVGNTDKDETERVVTGNSDNTFTFEQQWNNVFCFGKEINDFHTIDKQKLCALNFSATQELDRQQQVDKAKIASLETKVASLESELAAIKAHLGL